MQICARMTRVRRAVFSIIKSISGFPPGTSGRSCRYDIFIFVILCVHRVNHHLLIQRLQIIHGLLYAGGTVSGLHIQNISHEIFSHFVFARFYQKSRLRQFVPLVEISIKPVRDSSFFTLSHNPLHGAVHKRGSLRCLCDQKRTVLLHLFPVCHRMMMRNVRVIFTHLTPPCIPEVPQWMSAVIQLRPAVPSIWS